MHPVLLQGLAKSRERDTTNGFIRKTLWKPLVLQGFPYIHVQAMVIMFSSVLLSAPAYSSLGKNAKIWKRKHLGFTFVSGYCPRLKEKPCWFFGCPLRFVSNFLFHPLDFFSPTLAYFASFSSELFFFNMVAGHEKAFTSMVFEKIQKMTRSSKKIGKVQWNWPYALPTLAPWKTVGKTMEIH